MATAGSENFFQAHHERGGLAVIALVFRYEVRDPEEFERVYGPDGEWAQFFRRGVGYIGTELLRDVEEPERYLVIDRWESAEAYNAFLAEHQAEYLRRSRRSALPLHPGAAVRHVRERLAPACRSRRTMTRPAGAAATTRSGCTCRCRRRRG